jgi:carboxyl-terminal processing protease
VKYSGIGASIRYSKDRQGVQFQALVKDAPVTQAGVRPEDVVIAVNDQPVGAFSSVSDIAAIIRGPEGTPVTFTVRAADGAITKKKVIRRVVEFNRPARQ